MGVFEHARSGITLHLIPGGVYTLGQADPLDREAPPRQVTLAPFLIGRAPVLAREWAADEAAGVLPAQGVSWLEAEAWLSARGLRLPREDEWEAACRAGTTTPWFWGARFDAAWAWTHGAGGPQPVDRHTARANAFGLIDMAGNVSEWCQESLDAPMEGSSWQEWDPGRVHRGGSYDYPSRCCRSSYRGGTDPQRAYPDLGLRAALSLTS